MRPMIDRVFSVSLPPSPRAPSLAPAFLSLLPHRPPDCQRLASTRNPYHWGEGGIAALPASHSTGPIEQDARQMLVRCLELPPLLSLCVLIPARACWWMSRQTPPASPQSDLTYLYPPPHNSSARELELPSPNGASPRFETPGYSGDPVPAAWLTVCSPDRGRSGKEIQHISEQSLTRGHLIRRFTQKRRRCRSQGTVAQDNKAAMRRAYSIRRLGVLSARMIVPPSKLASRPASARQSRGLSPGSPEKSKS